MSKSKSQVHGYCISIDSASLKTINSVLHSIIFILIAQDIFGQSTIEGKVVNVTEEAIPFANVLLLNTLDSSLIKGELSDELGYYSFKSVQKGQYLIGSSYIGYNTYYSEFLDISGSAHIELDDIVLKEGVALGEIQVVAKKPLFEQKIDRLVVNVSNTITSAGATALVINSMDSMLSADMPASIRTMLSEG